MIYIALFRCLWVPGGGLEPFRPVLRSDGWLPLKKNTRHTEGRRPTGPTIRTRSSINSTKTVQSCPNCLMTAVDNSSFHSLFTKCPVSKVYLNHPRIAGFPTLAFHFCPVPIRIRLSWAQDLNFKVSDRAIVTKSTPAVEWHGAVLIMQITPCSVIF